MEKVALLLNDASGLEKIELLPYNPFAGAKYSTVNREYSPAFDDKLKPQVFTDAFDRYGIKYSIL